MNFTNFSFLKYRDRCSSFFVVSGALLLCLSIPRLLAEFMLVPGTAVLSQMGSYQSLSDNDSRLLEKSRRDAIRFADLPRFHLEIGLANIILAQRAEQVGIRTHYARVAIEEIQQALQRMPQNAAAWSQLGLAYFLSGQSNYSDALAAWRKSIQMATFEPAIGLQRIHLGILLHSVLLPSDLEKLKLQIELAYGWRRWELKAYVRQKNLVSWIVYLCGPSSVITESMLRP